MRIRGWAVAAAVSAAGCSHAAKTVPAEPAVAPAPLAVERAPVTPSAKVCSGDEQCGASELCVAARCVAITPGLAACRASVHFDFDRSDLRADDRSTLQRAARCLAALDGENALVEGNCDERGTVQYNVALGFRRAHAVARYVEDLGVAPARVSEVSYGEERPACTEATESCWSMNRRADLSPGARPDARVGGATSREQPAVRE